jgi:hypothetical protein
MPHTSTRGARHAEFADSVYGSRIPQLQRLEQSSHHLPGRGQHRTRHWCVASRRRTKQQPHFRWMDSLEAGLYSHVPFRLRAVYRFRRALGGRRARVNAGDHAHRQPARLRHVEKCCRGGRGGSGRGGGLDLKKKKNPSRDGATHVPTRGQRGAVSRYQNRRPVCDIRRASS